MSLDVEIAAYAIGRTPTDQLPSLASRWVREGRCSPALDRLASAHNMDSPEVRDLFYAALNELGLVVPTVNQAGMILARHIAGEVLNSTLTPYEGAKRIWTEIYLRLPGLKQLGPFVGLASAYEDDQERAETYSRQIWQHCEQLVNGSRSHAA